MRHLRAGRKFGKSPSHRRAMLRNMSMNLFKYERIKTTDPKAKELKKLAEKLITLGKRGTLHSRRMARTYIEDKAVLGKIFGELKERFEKRKGGYTRIIKLGPRRGDCAPMVYLELLPDLRTKPKAEGGAKKKKAKTKSKAKAKAKEVTKEEKKEDKPESEQKKEEKEDKAKE